ncbi:MAG: hypothetical protein GY763_02365 [Gammaproteobacteria bacterium]|nr:hypothetical protein [Gammaproteobacteria bacterium]
MASTTLVIQSHKNPLPFQWLRACLDSVESWARHNQFDYRFITDDVLFASLPVDLLGKMEDQKVIATDLGRLRVLLAGLMEGYQTVVWCDADFLIFHPDNFVLPESDYALGREVWVQHNEHGKLKSYTKVHNAFLMFRQGNHFLDFYADTAERLLRLNQGSMPAQFIGPKLLTALHNIVVCPVMENAGMLSPVVMRDLLSNSGDALVLFRNKSPVRIDGANLSASLSDEIGDIDQVIDMLLASGI